MYTVCMKDGRKIQVEYFDGGGIALTGEKRYEVHGHSIDPIHHGYFFCEYQDEIEKVLDQHGDEYIDFGNDLFPGHPASRGSSKDKFERSQYLSALRSELAG